MRSPFMLPLPAARPRFVVDVLLSLRASKLKDNTYLSTDLFVHYSINHNTLGFSGVSTISFSYLACVQTLLPLHQLHPAVTLYVPDREADACAVDNMVRTLRLRTLISLSSTQRDISATYR